MLSYLAGFFLSLYCSWCYKFLISIYLMLFVTVAWSNMICEVQIIFTRLPIISWKQRVVSRAKLNTIRSLLGFVHLGLAHCWEIRSFQVLRLWSLVLPYLSASPCYHLWVVKRGDAFPSFLSYCWQAYAAFQQRNFLPSGADLCFISLPPV